MSSTPNPERSHVLLGNKAPEPQLWKFVCPRAQGVQLEKVHRQQRTPSKHSQKKIIFFFFKKGMKLCYKIKGKKMLTGYIYVGAPDTVI